MPKKWKPTCPFRMKQDKVRIVAGIKVCDRCDAAF